MIIVLPEWTIELEEKLDKVIKDVAIKNNIDLGMIEDSKSIESGKNLISSSLVNIYENYDVEGRKRDKKFAEDMKKIMRKEKRSKK